MKKIAIVGAGISGLSIAKMLPKKFNVTIYEKEDLPGGLIRCQMVNGNLFHLCGGHVFNSKNEKVLNWFWSIFDKDAEFLKANRNSVVIMESGLTIPYPIENHVYMFDKAFQLSVYRDLVNNRLDKGIQLDNFEDFLKEKFGNTLYNAYFKPYNEKIWRCNLANIPLSWLEGKLPMPTKEEIIYNNINHVKEESFVHSKFWYEKEGGSQYIANTLSKDLDIRYNSLIRKIKKVGLKWIIESEKYDYVIFCGNIKELPKIIEGVDLGCFPNILNSFSCHGTTSVFCEIDPNPYSWIYLPSTKYQAHRIICTGNFSPNNNIRGKMTGTIEFTDRLPYKEIIKQLQIVPLHPKYLTHNYSECTYPIQNMNTRKIVNDFKQMMINHRFFMTGRFVDWEYYNMDICMNAAMMTVERINELTL